MTITKHARKKRSRPESRPADGKTEPPSVERTALLPIERQAYTILEFCAANGGISRGSFYKLDAQGLAPHTIRVGRRRLITREASQAWREMMGAR